MSNDFAFTATFIGNTGVGKTSILSAMYMSLEQASLPCGLSLFPKDEDEFRLLRDKWREMKRHIRSQTFGAAIQKPLYQGSEGFSYHDFCFTGDSTDRQSGIPIRIVDTKGGDTSNVNHQLVETVAGSFTVMCAVDATFLMECDADVNEVMNEVSSIKQILERALNKGDNLIMSVIFLLTKCEKYMHDGAKQEAMAAKFNREFRPVLELLRQKGVVAHYMPIQTMGCVELARIEECAGDTWSQEFQTVLGKEFDATDAVHPLSLLLQMVISLIDAAIQEQWNSRGLLERLLDTITFTEAPARLSGLAQAIADHFGPPKDWRDNKVGTLAEVVPVHY